MSENSQFLRKETRVSTVVWSVICIIAIIMLTLLALMLNRREIAVVGSVVLALCLSFVHGITQLTVLRDYRSSHSYLSMDGIMHICLTVIIAMASVLYLIVEGVRATGADIASSFDFRYMVAVFILVVAVWQCVVAYIAFRHRHFNAPVEALLAVSYVISAVGVIGEASFKNEDTAAVFLLVADFVLCAVTLFYLLFSYVFRSPEYLVTEEGLQALRREAEMQAQRAARFAAFAAPRQPGQPPIYPPQVPGTPAAPTPTPDAREDVTERLMKLKSLYDAGVVSEEEYQAKRRELLSRL